MISVSDLSDIARLVRYLTNHTHGPWPCGAKVNVGERNSFQSILESVQRSCGVRGGFLWHSGACGSPGATTNERCQLHNSQHAGDRENERDLEDHGKHVTAPAG